MFFISKQLLRLKLPETRGDFRIDDFIEIRDWLLGIKEYFLKNYLAKNNSNFVCVKTKNRLLVMPKSFYDAVGKFLDFRNIEVFISYNNLVAVNREKKQVYRMSFNKIGSFNLKNNYAALKNIQGILTPKPLSINESGNIVVTTETLLPGKPIGVGQAEGLAKDIFRELANFYKNNKQSSEFNLEAELSNFEAIKNYYPAVWNEQLTIIRNKILDQAINRGKFTAIKTLIHGDLTYKNILVNEGHFSFFDFDRSAVSFMEFDVWLFEVHRQTYLEKPSYELLLGKTALLISDKLQIAHIIFNKPIEKQLKYLFFYRMLILSLQNFKAEDPAAIKLLNYAQEVL